MLGHNAANEVIKVCIEELPKAPAASLVLSSLLCGRTFQSVLKDISFSQAGNNGKEYPCLAINLKYGSERWLVISDDITDNYNENICIFLPSFLSEGLKKAQSSEHIFDEAETLLKSLNSGSRYFTDTKIANYIDFKRFEYSISSAELTAIKNKDLANCVNAQYGQMNIGVIQSKLNYFIKTILAGFSQTTDIQTSPIIDTRNFGSNYTPSDNDVSFLFSELINGIKQTSQRDRENIREQFNLVTIYVAMYMTLITMHRSNGNVYNNFGNFNLVGGYFLINDKRDSERIVGLSNKAVTILRQYLDFVRDNLASYSMLGFSVALTVHRTLSGKEQAFYLFDIEGELVPFSFKLALEYLSNRNPALSRLKDNYLRHWVSSKLYDFGVNRDLIARIMGHSNQSEYRNIYSSCSLNELKDVAEIIQKEIIDEKLKLPQLGDLL
jgi:hypothetical protein